MHFPTNTLPTYYSSYNTHNTTLLSSVMVGRFLKDCSAIIITKKGVGSVPLLHAQLVIEREVIQTKQLISRAQQKMATNNNPCTIISLSILYRWPITRNSSHNWRKRSLKASSAAEVILTIPVYLHHYSSLLTLTPTPNTAYTTSILQLQPFD